MLVAVASPLVAIATTAALVAAILRRMPAIGLPACFMALGAALALVVRGAVSGPIWAVAIAGAGALAAQAALAFSVLTIDSQLDPWWWRRFERDLDAWRSGPPSARGGRRAPT